MARDLMCGRCRVRTKKQHRNSKWCHECAEELKFRPAGKLTTDQADRVRELLFKMPRDEIAREVGVSIATLKRWARDNGNIRLAFFNRYAANPTLVREVCAYYEQHGRRATEERFPHVKVRSIVERYSHAPRQLRWTSEQLVELVRMGGVVSKEAQAAYFKRPCAGAGSIQAAWWKVMGHGGGSVNGLAWDLAKGFVRPAAARDLVETEFWSHRQQGERRRSRRRILLWVDVLRHLRSDVPDHIREAIEAFARFQRWLHGGGYSRCRILRMIEEREREHEGRDGQGAQEERGEGDRQGRAGRGSSRGAIDGRGVQRPARRQQARRPDGRRH